MSRIEAALLHRAEFTVQPALCDGALQWIGLSAIDASQLAMVGLLHKRHCPVAIRTDGRRWSNFGHVMLPWFGGSAVLVTDFSRYGAVIRIVNAL
jgi:hypothetical protein